MEIRPTTPLDLDRLDDIDGTIDSAAYLHVERGGEALASSFRLEQRPLRERLIQSNPISDEIRFMLRQVCTGVEDGIALLAEHESAVVASILAVAQPDARILKVLDLRVDLDQRRQGLGLAMVFQLINDARQRGLRAVMAPTLTNNMPAAQLFLKAGFELAGLDCQRHSNHDLVKEAVSLFWYAALD